ncbi:putative uncharacterized protein C7orf71 [Macaca fascicularis]|uniref:putative uncharacterized protein C7orf71 n=1 Tax=Macaca fascicularis TaxID=9541 RepID=UPI003D15A5E9
MTLFGDDGVLILQDWHSCKRGRCTWDAHAQGKGRTRTQLEGDCVQVMEGASGEAKPAFILDFQPPEVVTEKSCEHHKNGLNIEDLECQKKYHVRK